MNNPFEGKAVRFETAEQLDHLAELARGYGLEVQNVSPHSYKYTFFRLSSTFKHYSNYANNLHNDTEIHYSDFVASIEAVKESKTVDNILMSHEVRDNKPDMVNHPSHYNVKGFEVIDIIDAYNLNFNMGNALKYLLRADRKGNKVQDLKKALWYLQREIEQSEKQK